MNNLRRNTRLIYYANYIGESPIIDEDGNETGETEAKYTEPTEMVIAELYPGKLTQLYSNNSY